MNTQNRLMRRLALTTLITLCLGTAPGAAQDVRRVSQDVTLRIVTYDDPTMPLFESRTYEAKIGPGIEFGAAREGRVGLDTVPVQIDIAEGRIAFAYSTTEAAGWFADALFNGYEVTFAQCLHFVDLTVTEATGIAMTTDRVSSDGTRLLVNVEGLTYTPQSRFTLSFDASPCVGS